MSDINWQGYMEQKRQKHAGLDKPSQFRDWILDLVDDPYGWGEENLFKADCSGTVCFPLWMMGYNVRTTADRLMKKIFLQEAGMQEVHLDDLFAAFFVDGNMKASHVAPFVGKEVVLNAGTRLTLMPVRSLILSITNRTFRIRKIDWDALDLVSRARSECYDVDAKLEELRHA